MRGFCSFQFSLGFAAWGLGFEVTVTQGSRERHYVLIQNPWAAQQLSVSLSVCQSACLSVCLFACDLGAQNAKT